MGNHTIIFSKHALSQMEERGAAKDEAAEAILRGEKVPAKKGRHAFRLNFEYNRIWGNKYYRIKQVMPIAAEEGNKLTVVTVYVFYF